MTRAPTDERPRIGVSACLLGAPVRFDGGHKRDDFITKELARFVDFVPVCPEMDLGLGAPRESLRLVGRANDAKLVAPRSGHDYTDAMRAYAERCSRAIARWSLDGFVFKKDSPRRCCGNIRCSPSRKRAGSASPVCGTIFSCASSCTIG